MLADLQSLPPAVNMAGAVDPGERFLVLDAAMMFYRGDPHVLGSSRRACGPFPGLQRTASRPEPIVRSMVRGSPDSAF